MTSPVPRVPPADIEYRVATFLGEFRMIIPAMGALFGFQLTVAFQASFKELPPVDQIVHFASICCSAAAILFLLVPASYHRLTARIEPTEEFLAFARKNIGVAFVFLPLAIVATLYIQAVRILGSHAAAAVAALVALGAFGLAWWAIPLARAHALGRLHGHESTAVKREAQHTRTPETTDEK